MTFCFNRQIWTPKDSDELNITLNRKPKDLTQNVDRIGLQMTMTSRSLRKKDYISDIKENRVLTTILHNAG